MTDQEDKLTTMRHSLAHIMAAAIFHLWPEAKFGIGPAVDDGFYYDIDIGATSLSEDDFPAIESEMQKIISRDEQFIKSTKPIDEAIAWAKQTGQVYKEELLNDLKRSGTTAYKDLKSEEVGTITDSKSKVKEVTFYQNGDFIDLCRGPHVSSTGQVGVFKLIRVSGAYWRGQETNPMLQRVYGAAFAIQDELDSHLKQLEEAKSRDHRRLGQELDLFVFSDMVGSGLPMFTPRGTVLRDALSDFSNELRQRRGFKKVWIPHMTKEELYKASGHWDKFGDELFLVKSQETKDQFVLKPMNCPHHTQIYASQPHSYRDLPIRYLETTTVYRDEKTGELNGLSRVRSATQDDSHVFCQADQIEVEINNLIEAAEELYKTIEMELRVRLSYRDDSDAYLGSPDLWKSAQEQLKKAAIANQIKFTEDPGEAAFYGPKIDFMVTDALGREHQVATVQLDFIMPERFKLEYAASDGSSSRPVMIHCALLGSIERFLSVYIEHTAGRFPVWLAPEQVRLLSVNQEEATLKYAQSIEEEATKLGLRLEIDQSNTSISKKIRQAETLKVPYVVVIGDKEIDSGQLLPRIRNDLVVQPRTESIGIAEFLKTVANETKSRVNKTSL